MSLFSMRSAGRAFFLLICLTGRMPVLALSPPVETGLPFIRNFPPGSYDFHPQNWAMVQDDRGVIFIANTAGLLEYDGVNWRRHALFDNLTIVSLALDASGTLFLGGRGQFGFARADSAGRLIYHSLLNHLPPGERAVHMVWETVATRHGVYFRTKNRIYRWNGQRLDTWDTPTAFGYIGAVRDTLYVLEKGTGLRMVSGDTLRSLPGGAIPFRVNAILPHDRHSILLVTATRGLYTYNGRQSRPFKTEADAFFRENRLYHGRPLSAPRKGWALATTRGGLIILDQQGRVRLHLNQETGLSGNKVHYVFEDRQGALWLSLNNGLARVEIAAPFTLFDQRLGIEGTPHVLIRHRGRLYVGTNRGVYRASGARFHPLPGMTGQVWALWSDGNDLLAGTASGIYRVAGQTLRAVVPLPAATYCFYSPPGTDRLYAGGADGLRLLTRDNGRWRLSGKVGGISQTIRTMTGDSILWLGTAFQGLLSVDMRAPEALTPPVRVYGPADGLPRGMNYVYNVERRVVVGTYRGLFRLDPGRQRFYPDSSLGPQWADSTLTINRLTQDSRGHLWLMAGRRKSSLYHGLPSGTGYRWQSSPFRRLSDMNSVLEIHPGEQGRVWLVGRDERIYRYQPEATRPGAPPFRALIRRISVIPGDSLIWGGYRGSPNPPRLAFDDNSLRFEYAATDYDQPSANRYSIRLEGYDAAFHPWTAETRKDYTGLPAGNYRFHVRARNIHGDSGQPASFALVILSPWYQRWWAWLLYGLGLTLLLTALVKARMRQLESKTRHLEQLVRERTGIIREQAEKLKALNTLKSRFFANISHEFRTPLTLIMGPIDDMLADDGFREGHKSLTLMRRNARRILQLINQLLDLSRLESGKLKLRVSRGDLQGFIHGIVTSFASLARQKEISLHCETEERAETLLREAWFDRDVIEKICYNLLSNAFKFSERGGRVSVNIGMNPEGEVAIRVADRGVGIPADRLETVFERFYQVHAGSTRAHEGTGIGLALTRELVELHHGRIAVSSAEGEGSLFTVTIPVRAGAFSAGEKSPRPATAPAVPIPEAVDTLPWREESREEAPAGDDASLILVVDDHADMRAYIRGHLEGAWQVREADNGHEGLRAARELIPDLVISDVMMPGMDGYHLCAALKEDQRTSHIPVILLTARAGERDKLSGLETGADDYLTKPFNSRELQVRVDNLIRLRRRLQERFRREGLLLPRAVEKPSMEEAFLIRLTSVLEEHLADEHFGVEALSAALNMGRRQLHRKIKAITGETPTGFIRDTRLQKARQLLEAGTGTVSEIAFQTGFASLPSFSRAFKEKFGKPPSAV